ncbi:MAG: tyrosine-type recombinase/integrase, partial [Pseudomonadota bacterium]
FYLEAAQASSTRRAYLSDLRHFEGWGGSVPALPDIVARYLADHAGHLAVSTLKRRVAAIAWAHREVEIDDPTKAPMIRKLMRGIERHHLSAQKQAAPLLIGDLQAIERSLGNTQRDMRDRALLTVGFFGGLRGAELLALRRNDVRRFDMRTELMIRRSKTDQSGRGRSISIPKLEARLCPSVALARWLDEGDITQAWVFAGNARSDSPLSTRQLGRIIKRRVGQIGLDPSRYSTHSLRAGFVTSAATSEIDAGVVARQTGHRSMASMGRYVRPDAKSLSRLLDP